MVMVLELQEADTPVGSPLAPETPLFEIPEAPEVVWVILVREVLMRSVGLEDAAPAVLAAETAMVPVAFTLPQPPVKGML